MAEEMGTMAYGPYAVGGATCFTSFGEEVFFGNKEGLVHHVDASGGRSQEQARRFQLHEHDVTVLTIGDYGHGPCLLSGSVRIRARIKREIIHSRSRAIGSCL